MADFKEEVTNLLGLFFNAKLLANINRSYDDEHPEELIELAIDMLSGMLGEDVAKRRLQPIMVKYHLENKL